MSFNTLLKIGLTGGIASGKSEVSRLFVAKGIDVIDADKIARDLFSPQSPLLSELKQKFGKEIFLDDDTLDRKALGKIVFNSAKDLNWLNQLTHPLVTREIKKQLSKVSSHYVVLDIPLLIDHSGSVPVHLAALVDRILVINVEPETQIQRICQRDNLKRTDAIAIIKNQSSTEQKMALADDIIDNDDSISALESGVTLLHNHYLNIARTRVEKL